MYCVNCGAPNDDGNQFCVNCNHSISGNPNANAQYPVNNAQPVYMPVNPEEHVSVGHWVGIFCINLIPCVGPPIFLIMLFVWAFGNTPKKSLKTYARAQLIIIAVLVVLGIIIFAVTAALGFTLRDYINNNAWRF